MKKLAFILTSFLIIASCSTMRVALVGDPQADSTLEADFARKSVFKELGERKDIDFAIFLGDLCNDKPELLEEMKAQVDSLPFECVCVPGNHDRNFYPKQKDGSRKKRDLATYRDVMGYVDTTFVRKGYRFILMNDVLPGAGLNECGFTPEQYAWLEKVLDNTPSKMPVVIAMHIPLDEFPQKDALSRLFAGHRTLAVCAHTHTAYRTFVEMPAADSAPAYKIDEIVPGTTCGTWWRGVPDGYGIPEARMNCGAPRGYGIADFSKNGYKYSYKTVQRDSLASAYVYQIPEPARKKGEPAPEFVPQDRLYVNVFSGHTEGVCEVKLPGDRTWHRLERVNETDPGTRILMARYRSMPKAALKAMGRDRIPVISGRSAHLWAGGQGLAEAIKDRGVKQIEVRYSDHATKVRCTIPVNFAPENR